MFTDVGSKEQKGWRCKLSQNLLNIGAHTKYQLHLIRNHGIASRHLRESHFSSKTQVEGKSHLVINVHVCLKYTRIAVFRYIRWYISRQLRNNLGFCCWDKGPNSVSVCSLDLELRLTSDNLKGGIKRNFWGRIDEISCEFNLSLTRFVGPASREGFTCKAESTGESGRDSNCEFRFS